MICVTLVNTQTHRQTAFDLILSAQSAEPKPNWPMPLKIQPSDGWNLKKVVGLIAHVYERLCLEYKIPNH